MQKPADKVIQDFQDVETKIIVKGVPKPTVAWYRNGQPLNTDEIEPNSGKPKNRVSISGDNQVNSEFFLTHFNPKDADNVKK